MFELGDFWLLAILIIVGLAATARWIVYKITGKELIPGDKDILTNLRTKVVEVIAENKHIIEIEKTQGRKAAKKEIENQIKDYIKSSTALTPVEKELLISLDMKKLVDFVEKELIRLGVLKEEEK